MSQERLAADTEIDRAYISEIERELGNPTIDLLDRLADLLGVGIAEFFVEPPPDGERPQSLPRGRRPGGSN